MASHTTISPAEGYTRFIDAAREAEAIIQSRPDVDETSLSEGYAYLAGMWMFHLERAFKSYDVDNPCFIRDMDSFRNWGLPTPDHHYYSAQIDGTGKYKITGNRGTVVDFCFEVLSGLVGDEGDVGERISAIEEKDIVCDTEGNFEIIVGGPAQENNWLASSKHARCIFVRQTVDDWLKVRPTPMVIERIDASPTTNKRLTAPTVANLYDVAARNMVNQIRFLNNFSLYWQQELPVNALPAPSVGPSDAGYFPGQFNTKCQFMLERDHALLITVIPSSAQYESLSLAHPQWFNSINPRLVQSSLNSHQAQPSKDGKFRYIISACDPGFPNWLDTAGLLTGFLFIRYQQANPENPPPKPSIEALHIEDLCEKLSQQPAYLSPNGLSAALSWRRTGLDKRHF